MTIWSVWSGANNVEWNATVLTSGHVYVTNFASTHNFLEQILLDLCAVLGLGVSRGTVAFECAVFVPKKKSESILTNGKGDTKRRCDAQ